MEDNYYFNKLKKDQEEYNAYVDNYYDFAFDTLYFRYSEVVNELMIYKAKCDNLPLEKILQKGNQYKERFYRVLERIIKAPHSTQESMCKAHGIKPGDERYGTN